MRRRDPLRFLAGTAAIAVCGAALVLCLLLGLVAFSRPTVRNVEAGTLYRQAGAFSYSAVVPQSPFYDGRRISTGDAVFTRVVPELPVRFTYALLTPWQHDVTTKGSLVARVSDGFGWVRTLDLSGSTRAASDRLTLTGVLDMAAVRRMIREFEEATGKRNDSYHVAISPTVELAGVVAGRPVDEVFSPTLAFVLDSARMVIPPPSPGDAAQDLTPSSSTPRLSAEPGTIALFGRHVAVSAARTVALVGGAISLVALLAVLLLGARTRRDDHARAESRYGRLLVPVASVQRRAPETTVRVESMDALARIAERYDRMILHEDSESGRSYFVEDDGVVYSFDPASAPAGTASTPLRPDPAHP